MASAFRVPPLKVLIVEDEALVRMIAAESLVDAGFVVVEAATADEALATLTLEAAEVDLLFSDIQMPGRIDGLELATIVHDRWPWIAVMLASGALMPLRSEMPQDTRFIPKPYEMGYLVDQAHDVLGFGSIPS
jgi:CheY-like chemotaxis protein